MILIVLIDDECFIPQTDDVDDIDDIDHFRFMIYTFQRQIYCRFCTCDLARAAGWDRNGLPHGLPHVS